jgi:cytidylate kinase
MTQKGEKVAFEEVFKNVNERDQIDTSRKDSPLVKADDAILLDNSDLDAEQTFVKAMELVNKSLK